MKSSSKRILSILTAILIVVASIFIYASFILPAYFEIKDLRSEIAGRFDLINKHKFSVEQVKELLNEYQDIGQLQETISGILPIKQNLPLAADQIIGLANFNGLAIESLSIQQLAIKPSIQSGLVKGIGVLRINSRLAGNYEKFKSFLRAMETNITLIDLKSLKVESKTKGADSFYYAMVVDTYYQTE